MFTLTDLLRAPNIRLSEREHQVYQNVWIRRVYVLKDLADVEELRGDELVLVDARQGGATPDVRRLTDALVEYRAAVLAFAPPAGKGISRSLAIACKRRGLPLIEIPQSVTCQRMAEAAASLLNPDSGEPEPPQQVRYQHSRVMALAARGSMQSTLNLVERDYGGARLWLVTGGGVLHASMQPPPTDEDVNLVASTALQNRGIFDLGLSTGTTARVCPLDMPGRPGWHAGHLVCELPGDDLSSELNAAVEHALALLESQLELVYARREARRPSEEEFMSRIDAGQANSEDLEAWSRALGFKSETYLLCMIARASNAHSSDLGQVAHYFRDLADSLQVAHVVATADQEARAFLFLESTKDERIQKGLDRGSRLLHVRLAQIGIKLGRSSVAAHGVGDFLQTLLEARRVCVFNSLRADTDAGTSSQAERSLSAMLLNKDVEASAVLYEAVLEPLSRYDTTQGRSLVNTLDVFLSTGCQWNTSATELGIHVNTLRYRLARIEELTGKKIASMADRVDFYLALRVCEVPDLRDREHG